MKKVKAFISKRNWGVYAVNALALSAAILSVNSACLWFHYQPETPDEMKKYRKF